MALNYAEVVKVEGGRYDVGLGGVEQLVQRQSPPLIWKPSSKLVS